MALDLRGDLNAARAISTAGHTFLSFCEPMLGAPKPLRYLYARFDDGQTFTYNDGDLIIAYPGLGRATLAELDAYVEQLERGANRPGDG
jgi:hypothetical protein